MLLIILLSFFTLAFATTTVGPVEMCFHSHRLMDVNYEVWRTVADNMNIANKTKNKTAVPTIVKLNPSNHCVIVKGDKKTVQMIKDFYEEEKKKMPWPMGYELKNIGLNVYISGIKEPFLSLPEITSSEIYDSEKRLVKISAKMLHPELIELTYSVGKKSMTKTYHIDERIHCLHMENSREHYYKNLEGGMEKIESLRFKAERK